MARRLAGAVSRAGVKREAGGDGQDPVAQALWATGRRGRPDALVFGRTEADPFLRSTPRRRARRAWSAAGLEPITMHECRHTYAEHHDRGGVGPGEVMRRMGHSTIAMT